MRKLTSGLIAGLLLSLGACASTPTVYAPAGDSGRGYSETRIEDDRFRIIFEAGADMSIRRAEDMALRRAAEVTLANGGEWFIVVSRGRDGNNRDPVRVGGTVGQTFGSRGYRGSSVGIGVQFDPSAGEKRAILEILVRSGPREDGPDVYIARDILDYIPS